MDAFPFTSASTLFEKIKLGQMILEDFRTNATSQQRHAIYIYCQNVIQVMSTMDLTTSCICGNNYTAKQMEQLSIIFQSIDDTREKKMSCCIFWDILM